MSDDLDWLPSSVDTSVAHPARTYDYLLGGKDNFPADRAVVEEALKFAPEARDRVRANRAFLRRVVKFLVGEVGIRQILDIGTGLPTQDNVHEVASRLAPDTRVVYVDNDPIVLVHAQALLSEEKTTTVIQADMRSPQAILDHPETRRMLDFDQPMAVLLISILHFIEDAEDPAGLVARLRDAMAPGSYLAISHLTTDLGPGAQQVARLFDRAAARMVPRSGAQIEGFFGDWDLVEPGMVQLPLWRPDEPIPDNLDKIWFYGAVARKP